MNNHTLIIFASKYGTTARASQKIAEGVNASAVCYDCKNKSVLSTGQQPVNRIINLADYDAIILGTAMYMGNPISAFKKYCAAHEKELLNHPLYFFTCGVGTKQEDEEYLRKSLPASLSGHAALFAHLGGDIVPEHMNAFERLAMKEYVKQRGAAPGIDEQAIAELCAALNNRT